MTKRCFLASTWAVQKQNDVSWRPLCACLCVMCVFVCDDDDDDVRVCV